MHRTKNWHKEMYTRSPAFNTQNPVCKQAIAAVPYSNTHGLNIMQMYIVGVYRNNDKNTSSFTKVQTETTEESI